MDPMTILSLVGGGFRAVGSAIWGFIKQPPGIYVACVVVLAGAVWWWGHHEYNRGVADNEAIHKAASAKAEEQIALADTNFEAELKNMAANALSAWASAEDHLVFLVQTQKSEIVRYVTPEVDARYPVPCSLWRMHDAARLAVSPSATDSTSCGADDEPAPAGASVLSSDIFDDWKYTGDVEADRDYWKNYALGLYKSLMDYRSQLIASGGRQADGK